MPPSQQPDDSLLLIRCPSCGQRFKVGEDLRHRTVECGGCEHRFKIQDEVIVRGRKFYPGERHDPSLNRFPRVPLSAAPAADGVRYLDPPDLKTFEPTSPQRIIAGIIGAVLMTLIALMLILGASHGGVLDGMITENRVMMAAFAGVLGCILLLYANPRSRGKALLCGVLATAALVTLPFFFQEGSSPLTRKIGTDLAAFAVKPPKNEPEITPISKLRETIGTQPLEEQIKELEARSSSKHAMGLWLRDLRQQNRLLVRDYVERITGVTQIPHFYPRGTGDFLLVISGTDHTLAEVAEFAKALGKVENIHNQLSVIEVRVDNTNFEAIDVEKLSKQDDPAFYDFNLKELDSIDLERVSAAVKRLSQAEPKVYRADITRKLITLLGTQWVNFKGEVCAALAVWSDKPGPAGDKALVETKNLLAKKAEIPKDMIDLIVKEKNPGIIPILNQLWKEKPTEWERLYGDLGALAEPSLIDCFAATEGGLRQSAVRLLGRVGSEKSVPVLNGIAPKADSEMKVLIENALAAIQQRATP